jgi:hypothetical protein
VVRTLDDNRVIVKPRAGASGAGFDWAATTLSALFTGGLFLDGWAHTHGRVDDTFFTPWHAALYSGFLALALLLAGRAAWGVAREGLPWRRPLPAGYGLSLAGVAFWFVGGPFDAVWHGIFGFEADVEALMSPAHAILAMGFGLMASGPLRAGLHRRRQAWWRELPMILSLTFVVSNLTFFTQIAHPISNLWGARGGPAGHGMMELGITGMVLSSVIVTAPLLFLLRHDRLPAGATIVLVGLNALAMGVVFDQGPYPLAVVLATLAAAAVVDALRVALQPDARRPRAYRTFAGLMPVTLTALYFAALAATSGIAWSTHVWVGVVIFSGVAGWLLSYLILSPQVA